MINRVSSIACALLLIAFVHLLYDRGGPYFARPATPVDHVFREKHDLYYTLRLLRRVQPLLPRGARVTCFRPDKGKWRWDVPSFHGAIAMLPQQFVLPPYSASDDIPKATMVDYVIAVNDPFTNPAYHLEAEFPEGRLYKVSR